MYECEYMLSGGMMGGCFRSVCGVLSGLWTLFFVKQKTAYEMRISDWSSDVCSSDLGHRRRHRGQAGDGKEQDSRPADAVARRGGGIAGDQGLLLAIRHVQGCRRLHLRPCEYRLRHGL